MDLFLIGYLNYNKYYIQVKDEIDPSLDTFSASVDDRDILPKSLIMRGLGLGSEIPDNLSTFIIAYSLEFCGNKYVEKKAPKQHIVLNSNPETLKS